MSTTNPVPTNTDERLSPEEARKREDNARREASTNHSLKPMEDLGRRFFEARDSDVAAQMFFHYNILESNAKAGDSTAQPVMKEAETVKGDADGEFPDVKDPVSPMDTFLKPPSENHSSSFERSAVPLDRNVGSTLDELPREQGRGRGRDRGGERSRGRKSRGNASETVVFISDSSNVPSIIVTSAVDQ